MWVSYCYTLTIPSHGTTRPHTSFLPGAPKMHPCGVHRNRPAGACSIRLEYIRLKLSPKAAEPGGAPPALAISRPALCYLVSRVLTPAQMPRPVAAPSEPRRLKPAPTRVCPEAVTELGPTVNEQYTNQHVKNWKSTKPDVQHFDV